MCYDANTMNIELRKILLFKLSQINGYWTKKNGTFYSE